MVLFRVSGTACFLSPENFPVAFRNVLKPPSAEDFLRMTYLVPRRICLQSFGYGQCNQPLRQLYPKHRPSNRADVGTVRSDSFTAEFINQNVLVSVELLNIIVAGMNFLTAATHVHWGLVAIRQLPI